MEWTKMPTLPKYTGVYTCFVPECDKWLTHIEEYEFDGKDFRDHKNKFLGRGKIMTKYITHWFKIQLPEK